MASSNAHLRAYLSKDARGILRGKCTQCKACDGYCAQVATMKCVCGHPPAKHKNENDQVGEGTTNMDVDDISSYPGSHEEERLAFSQEPQYEANWLYDDRPQCTNRGCSKKVHYDPNLPKGMNFEYCSQDCRDRNLVNLSEVQKEIQDLEKQLQQIGVPVVYHEPKKSKTAFHKESPKPLIDKDKPSVSSNLVKHQKTIPIKVIKGGAEKLGLSVIRDDPSGLIITGVDINCKIYKDFQGDKICLLDIITKVYSDMANSVDDLEMYTKDRSIVELTLNRSNINCLHPMAKILSNAPSPFTHVFALLCKAKSVGIEVNEVGTKDLRIVKTCEDGIGRRSGLKIGDRITMCCTIQDQHVKEYRSCKNIKEILESENQQCNLVLFINRGNDC